AGARCGDRVRRADRRQWPARGGRHQGAGAAGAGRLRPRPAARARAAAADLRQRRCPGRSDGGRREASARLARTLVHRRAAVCREYGPPEVVRIEDFPSPPRGSGQVRVRVEAAAVNFPDVLVVANQYQVSVPPPFVPGSEFAGTVVEVGDGVSGIATGDRVFGSTMVGAFAEEVAVPAASLARIPDGVEARHAAAFGGAHGAAYHVLRSVARLEAGEQLIVLGAGGGVGLAAVQLGAALGASVTAVASSAEKLEVAKLHGAGILIDHKAGDLRQALRKA